MPNNNGERIRMVVEHHIVRKIYVAECKCDPQEPFRDVKTNNPPRERMCPKCGTWISFHEETASSPKHMLLFIFFFIMIMSPFLLMA